MVNFAVRRSYFELFGNCSKSGEQSYLKKGTSNFMDSKEAMDEFTKQKPQFHYGNVNYQQFKGSYATFSGVYRRKAIAIPFAAYAGIIKSTYHIAATIFLIIKMGTSDYHVDLEAKNYINTHIYYVARDLQESYGWLTAIFNECYGQYHIQESELHKTMYSNFMDSYKDPKTSSSTMMLDKELQAIRDLGANDSVCFQNRCINLSRSYMRLNILEKSFEAVNFHFPAAMDIVDTLLEIAIPSIEQGNTSLAESVVLKLCNMNPDLIPPQILLETVTDLMSEGKDDIAKEFISLLSANKPNWKSELVLGLIEEYLSNDELAKSQQIIEDEIDDESEKAKLLLPIMQAYLSKEDFENAFRIANELLTDVEMKDSLIDNFIESCIEKQNIQLALDKLEFMSNSANNKKTSLDKIISGCTKEEEIQHTYDYISNHTSEDDLSHYEANIADAFLKMGYEEKGIKILSRGLVTGNNKCESLIKLIKFHLRRGDFDAAKTTLSAHIDSLEPRENDTVFKEIADHCANKYPLDETFFRLDGLEWEHIQEPILAHMIFIYDAKRNAYNVSAILKKMLVKALYDRAFLSLERTSFTKKMNDPEYKNVVDDFFAKLIENQMPQIKNKTSRQIPNIVKNIASYFTYLRFQSLKASKSQSEESSPTTTALTSQLDSMTHYQVLDLPSTASKSEIRISYLNLSLQYHSDRVHKTDLETPPEFAHRKNESEERMKYINRSYEILSGKSES